MHNYEINAIPIIYEKIIQRMMRRFKFIKSIEHDGTEWVVTVEEEGESSVLRGRNLFKIEELFKEITRPDYGEK